MLFNGQEPPRFTPREMLLARGQESALPAQEGGQLSGWTSPLTLDAGRKEVEVTAGHSEPGPGGGGLLSRVQSLQWQGRGLDG